MQLIGIPFPAIILASIAFRNIARITAIQSVESTANNSLMTLSVLGVFAAAIVVYSLDFIRDIPKHIPIKPWWKMVAMFWLFLGLTLVFFVFWHAYGFINVGSFIVEVLPISKLIFAASIVLGIALYYLLKLKWFSKGVVLLPFIIALVIAFSINLFPVIFATEDIQYQILKIQLPLQLLVFWLNLLIVSYFEKEKDENQHTANIWKTNPKSGKWQLLFVLVTILTWILWNCLLFPVAVYAEMWVNLSVLILLSYALLALKPNWFKWNSVYRFYVDFVLLLFLY